MGGSGVSEVDSWLYVITSGVCVWREGRGSGVLLGPFRDWSTKSYGSFTLEPDAHRSPTKRRSGDPS